MAIISVRDYENNRWKRNAKKKKRKKEKKRKYRKEYKIQWENTVTEAIVKGWELNDFVVDLS